MLCWRPQRPTRNGRRPAFTLLSSDMASKKYQNQTCVYGATAVSTTADHVIARQFVREPLRATLPKVPACNNCTNRKAKLEHYLTAVLPFASRGPDASVQLAGPVRDRLARNTKLHREL